jgi:colanic acid biosynthesis glycosyl transferase WcaI
MAQGLSNVRFVDLQPANRLNELLNLADIHLLPQRSGVADLVMPSKLGPMLASGRPVIATVAPGTQVAMVIANCGIAVPPGDTSALVKAIQCLAADPTLRRHLGENARREAEAEPSAEQLLDRMEDHLRVSHGNPSRNRDRVTIVKGGAARPVRD